MAICYRKQGMSCDFMIQSSKTFTSCPKAFNNGHISTHYASCELKSEVKLLSYITTISQISIQCKTNSIQYMAGLNMFVSTHPSPNLGLTCDKTRQTRCTDLQKVFAISDI